jgi:hypothetical protein
MSALGACPSSTLYLEEHINENKSAIYHYMVEHFKQNQKSIFLLSDILLLYVYILSTNPKILEVYL